jgi:hypothetical protein
VVKTAALQITDARAITISNIACRTDGPDRADPASLCKRLAHPRLRSTSRNSKSPSDDYCRQQNQLLQG